MDVTATGQSNRLLSLQFTQTSNALVDVGGQNGRTGAFSVSLPANTTSTTFYVRRAAAGPTTAMLSVVDLCGSWQTFVGGGTGGGVSVSAGPAGGIKVDAGGVVDLLEMPDDPLSLLYAAAWLLQVPLAEKQPLLEAQTSAHLLHQLRRLYRRELAVTEHLREISAESANMSAWLN